jgi:hypothetical protein
MDKVSSDVVSWLSSSDVVHVQVQWLWIATPRTLMHRKGQWVDLGLRSIQQLTRQRGSAFVARDRYSDGKCAAVVRSPDWGTAWTDDTDSTEWRCILAYRSFLGVIAEPLANCSSGRFLALAHWYKRSKLSDSASNSIFGPWSSLVLQSLSMALGLWLWLWSTLALPLALLRCDFGIYILRRWCSSQPCNVVHRARVC